MPNTVLSDSPKGLPNDSDYLHVAIGVICKANYASKNVLISKRSEEVHLGGLWEFPGGKIEAGESVIQALYRELNEELGILITKAEPLITIPCFYPEVKVLLEVWLVTQFTGRASAKENQPIKWINQNQLAQINFPKINKHIINALNLATSYVITENIDLNINNNKQKFIQQFTSLCQQSYRLIQLRFKATDFTKISLEELLLQLFNIANSNQINLQLNSEHLEALNNSKFIDLNLGVHLSSKHLHMMDENKLAQLKAHYRGYISASCHCLEDVFKANQLNLDFIVLSPVNKTPSHTQAQAMGWQVFEKLTKQAQMPVYALGGMILTDLDQAKAHGGQGIAGISCFFNNKSN